MLFRTEIIVITPKYFFFNQTEHHIVVSQTASNKLQAEEYFRLYRGENRSFFWPSKNGEQIIFLSFYSQNSPDTDLKFSNPFKIDEVLLKISLILIWIVYYQIRLITSLSKCHIKMTSRINTSIITSQFLLHFKTVSFASDSSKKDALLPILFSIR